MNHAVIRTFLLAAMLFASLMITEQPASAATVKYLPSMTAQSLAGRPDTDFVEFSNGRKVSVGQMRRLDHAAKIIQAPKINKMPATLKAKPTGKIIPVANGRDLAYALKNPDGDAIQLPTGQRVTVGMVKFMQPYIEKKLGRKLDDIPRRPELSGPAIHVSKNTTKEEWKTILRKPDNTVLQSPNGARVTIAELKPYLIKRAGTGRTAPPVKSTPPSVVTPQRKGGAK